MTDKFIDEVKQIVEEYLQGFFKNSSTERSVIIPKDFEIKEADYTEYIDFIGTAHLSSRSVNETIQAINNTRSIGICLELCPYRYEYLSKVCDTCLEKNICPKKCEFIAAIEALEKTSIDVWLIDMNQEEITARVLALASTEEAKTWQRLQKHISEREAYGLRLWEEGLKDEAVRLFNGDLEVMRRTFPTLWQVLILERNALMASRLIYLIAKYLDKGLDNFKLTVFTGIAHVEGIKELLKKPKRAFELLDHFGVAFSLPHAIRRV